MKLYSINPLIYMKNKKLPLHTKIFIGLFTGLAAGLISNIFFNGNPNVLWTVNNLAYPLGQVFLRLIFMIIVPLIFSAIALGVADFGEGIGIECGSI